MAYNDCAKQARISSYMFIAKVCIRTSGSFFLVGKFLGMLGLSTVQTFEVNSIV